MGEHFPYKEEVVGSSPSFRTKYAVCPGGEGAVLKTVGCNRLAGSNPVHGAIWETNSMVRVPGLYPVSSGFESLVSYQFYTGG